MEILKKYLNDKIVVPNSVFDEIIIDWKNKDRGLFNLYISKAIESKLISPELFFIRIVNIFKEKEAIILLALVFRYCIDKNFYVSASGSNSNIHIIIYCLSILGNNNDILEMFLILGSDFNFLVQQIININRENIDLEFIRHIQNSNQNVRDWMKINNINIPTPTIEMKILCNVYNNEDNKKSINIDFFRNLKFTSFLDVVITCRSFNYLYIINNNVNRNNNGNVNSNNNINVNNNVNIGNVNNVANNKIGNNIANVNTTFNNFFNDNINIFNRGKYNAISICIDKGASETFKYILLNNPEYLTYFSINYLCLSIKYYHIVYLHRNENNNVILFLELLQMITYAVSIGIKIDLHQLNIIPDEYKKQIIDEYSQPYWQKSCKTNGINNDLKKIAFNLNETTKDKKELCSNLEKYSKLTNQQLLEEQKKRSNKNDIKTISDCKNPINISEYTRGTVYNYIDSDNNNWCFLPEDFSQLISKRKNIYNNENLSDNLVKDLTAYNIMLEDLGIIKAESINNVYNQLHENDTINNNESNKIVNTIEQSALILNVPVNKLRELNYDQMNAALKTIKMEQNELQDLTREHQYVTFCRAAYEAIKREYKNAEIFFKAI